MGTGNFQDKQRETIVGVIMGLLRQLGDLPPHPDRPGYKGPLFIKNDPHCIMAAEYDGMLGSLMMESLLGMVFADAAALHGRGSFAAGAEDFADTEIDWSNAADAASEYWKDRCQVGTRRVIAGAFNARGAASRRNALMDAFLQSLPQRLAIERQIARHSRALENLSVSAAAPPECRMAA